MSLRLTTPTGLPPVSTTATALRLRSVSSTTASCTGAVAGIVTTLVVVLQGVIAQGQGQGSRAPPARVPADAHAVDVGAVAAAEVAHPHHGWVDVEHAVVPRHGPVLVLVGQPKGAVVRAADKAHAA